MPTIKILQVKPVSMAKNKIERCSRSECWQTIAYKAVMLMQVPMMV
jgi:hypothetical protein